MGVYKLYIEVKPQMMRKQKLELSLLKVNN